MSQSSYLIQFPMERVTVTSPLFRALVSFVQVFFLHGIANLVGRLYHFLLRPYSDVEGFGDFEQALIGEKEKHQRLESIEGKDMELVMAKLGICLDPKGEKIGFDNDITNIFEEKEPSLEEVKEAFDVFDENKDGFIDEEELKRVLFNLGLNEGLDMQSCKRMISRYDDNGDGRIEFKEFVKLMEKTFC